MKHGVSCQHIQSHSTNAFMVLPRLCISILSENLVLGQNAINGFSGPIGTSIGTSMWNIFSRSFEFGVLHVTNECLAFPKLAVDLFLADNDFQGEIPSEIFQMTALGTTLLRS